jgi:hypothetical protein
MRDYELLAVLELRLGLRGKNVHSFSSPEELHRIADARGREIRIAEFGPE